MDARSKIKLRVIIVDDIERWRNITKRYVELVCQEKEYHGVKSVSHSNPYDALDEIISAYCAKIIPVLVTDIHFTKEGKDARGLELIHRVRQDAQLKETSIIGMTSDGEYRSRIEELKAKYVAKPKFRSELYTTLKNTLEEKLGR